jgi:hypothetical protein
MGFFRYKVVVEVVYGGHNAEFVFWDRECLQIIGITADALRKTMQEVSLFRVFGFRYIFDVIYRNHTLCFFFFVKVGEDDPLIYPTHLDKLLGLEFAFRAKYQPRYHQSSVLGFSRDPAGIEKIKAHLHPGGP